MSYQKVVGKIDGLNINKIVFFSTNKPSSYLTILNLCLKESIFYWYSLMMHVWFLLNNPKERSSIRLYAIWLILFAKNYQGGHWYSASFSVAAQFIQVSNTVQWMGNCDIWGFVIKNLQEFLINICRCCWKEECDN